MLDAVCVILLKNMNKNLNFVEKIYSFMIYLQTRKRMVRNTYINKHYINTKLLSQYLLQVLYNYKMRSYTQDAQGTTVTKIKNIIHNINQIQ